MDCGRFRCGMIIRELPPAAKQELNGLLDRVAGSVIYSRQHLIALPYQTQPGDTLDRIAEAYEVPWQLLAKINGISDPQRLRPGEQLKVFRGPFHAVVNLQRYEMTLYLGDRYAGRFKIGIGKDHSTPLGDHKVLDKVRNPAYYGPDGKAMGPNDPQNPLGGYWIDLGNKIGIHGTIDPHSIGREIRAAASGWRRKILRTCSISCRRGRWCTSGSDAGPLANPARSR